MIKPVRFALEAFVGVACLAALATGLLISRLEQGPIELSRFLPEVQDLMADTAPGLDFTINKAIIEKSEDEDGFFRIHLYDVTVRNTEEATIGNLQDMTLGFSWSSFLTLSFVPSTIDIAHPSVHLMRFEDGHVGFNLKPEEQPEKSRKARMPELARLLARSPAALREIRVHDAWVRFEDKKDNWQAQAENGLFVFQRDGGKVTGILSLDVKAKDFDQTIRGTIDYDPEQDITRISAAIKDFAFDKLSFLLPALPEGVLLDLPINVYLTAAVDRLFQLKSIDMQLTGMKGALTYPDFFPESLQIGNLVGIASYDTTKNILEVKDLAFMLANKIRIKAQARLLSVVPEAESDTTPPTQRKLEMTGYVENMPVSELKNYWPHKLGHNAWEWVTEHLSKGVVPRAGVDVAVTISPENEVTIDKLGGKILFKGVTVNYLPPMPPVKKVAGEATFDTDNFNLVLNAGTLFETQIKNADIRITDFDQEHQKIAIDIDMTGPAKDALTTIASKPLEYPQRMGLSPDQFSGTSHTLLKLQFPLFKNLKLDQVQMQTEATLDNLVVRNVVKDLTASGSALMLKADTHELSLTGKVSLADAPTDLTWHEYFSDDAKYTTTIDVKGAMTPAVLKGLRLPLDSYFKGAAEADVTLTQDHKKNVSVAVQADLAKAEITIPELGISKITGAPGKLSLNVLSEKSGPTTVSDANISWNDFSVSSGMLRFNNAQDLESATLKGLRSGRTRADVVATPITNGVRIAMTGDVIDLSGYWNAKKAPDTKPDARRMDITLSGNKVYFNPETPFDNFRADLSMVGGDLVRGTLNGTVGKEAQLKLQQSQMVNGVRVLSVDATNAGAVFQALNMLTTVQGGTLTIRGQSTPDAPSNIQGTMHLSKFTVVKAPVLARLVNAISPVGLLELLNNNGLVFNELKSKFAMPAPKTIRLKDGRMAGTSLGMSFSGYIYRAKDTVSLKGTIVPIEGLNRIAGKIPIIGQILTGLKGEGLIAATYKIKGPTDDPEVTVNPLSVLAPGILRSIFFGGKDE